MKIMGSQAWSGRKTVASARLLGALFVATAILSAVAPGGSGAPSAPDRAANAPSTSTTGVTSLGPATEPPASPVSVVASPGASEGEVDVRWTPGPGPPATRFVVIASPGGANATAAAQRDSASVLGLIPGAGYTFTVFAANSAGQSSPSEPTGAVRAKEPAPTALPPPSPPSSPGPRFADCTADQLQIVFQRSEVFSNNGTVGLVEIRNASPTECSLEGIAVLQMLDTAGNDDISSVWVPDTSLKTHYQTAVNLPAGSPPITVHGRRSGHAFFWIGWTGRGGCSHGVAGPDQLQITLPINGSTLVVPAVAADRSRIEACQNALYVEPFTTTP